MIDHIGIEVNDYARSKSFYEAALAPLGYTAIMAFDDAAGFGADGNPDFWISQGNSDRASTHVAFQCAAREQVDKVYTAALKAGGKDNGPPGIREAYSPTYYAAYFFDPDGNNIEVVCHLPQ